MVFRFVYFGDNYILAIFTLSLVHLQWWIMLYVMCEKEVKASLWNELTSVQLGVLSYFEKLL